MPLAPGSFCRDNALHVDLFGDATEFTWQAALDEIDIAGLIADAVRVDGNVKSFKCDAAIPRDTFEQVDAIQRIGLGLNGVQP